MLEKCLVGNYINPTKIDASNKTKTSTLNVLKTLQIPVLPTANLTLPKSENDTFPVLDSYQSLDRVTLVFYTKINQLYNEHIIFDIDEKTGYLIVDIYNFESVYEFKIGNRF
jgi:hypothetical protein